MVGRVLLTSPSIQSALNAMGIDTEKGVEKEKLQQIKRLILKNAQGIEELQYFTGLNQLAIIGDHKGYTKVLNKRLAIPFLPCLEQLVISYLDGVDIIDVHKCEGLKELTVKHVNEINQIVGAYSLSHIEKIWVENCMVREFAEDMNVCFEKRGNQVKIYLDIRLLPQLMRRCTKEEVEALQDGLYWIERGVFSGNVVITTKQALKLKRLMKVLYTPLFDENHTDLWRIHHVYTWMCNEFVYDSQLYIERTISEDGLMSIHRSQNGNEQDYSASSYYLMLNKSAGTEGFVHFLTTVLDMMGYHVNEVMCCIENKFNKTHVVAKEYEDVSTCNHMLVKIETEDGALYLDPVMDSILGFEEDEGHMTDIFMTKKDVLRKYRLEQSEEKVMSMEPAFLSRGGEYLTFVHVHEPLLFVNGIEQVEQGQDKVGTQHEEEQKKVGSFSQHIRDYDEMHRSIEERKVVEEDEDDDMATTYIGNNEEKGYCLVDQNGKVLCEVTDEVRIGRLKDNDLCFLRNTNVGRRHCVITKNSNAYFIEDLGSRNGTRVNNSKISRKLQLLNGDKIAIADEIIFFKQKI